MKRTYIIIPLLIVFTFFSLPTAEAQQSQKIMLAGYNHQPTISTPGSGMATVQLKGDTLKVHGDFENLTSPYTGAYLMVNLRGQPGNQLYRLKAELNDERTGGAFKAEANSFALTPAEKQLLKKGEVYINIASAENRKGELRGDISPLGN